MIRRLLIISSTCCSALLSSQAPEFAQQYRQRLGGALQELQTVVSNFDNDAAKLNLSREQALHQLASAKESFFQTRATSMQQTFERFETLTAQQNTFNSLSPALRPLALFSKFDSITLNGTRNDFQPAVPLSTYGALWTIAGGFFGWVFMRMFSAPFSKTKTIPRKKSNKPTL